MPHKYGKLLCLAFIAALFCKTFADDDSLREVEIQVGDNMKFSVVEIRLRPGQLFKVVMKNTASKANSEIFHNIAFLKKELTTGELHGATSHMGEDFKLPENLREICFGETSIVNPEEETEVELQAPLEKGNYTFFCTIPGHAFLGMQGVLIVE